MSAAVRAAFPGRDGVGAGSSRRTPSSQGTLLHGFAPVAAVVSLVQKKESPMSKRIVLGMLVALVMATVMLRAQELDIWHAVANAKVAGPELEIWRAVVDTKVAGPELDIWPAVKDAKAAGPEIEVQGGAGGAVRWEDN